MDELISLVFGVLACAGLAAIIGWLVSWAIRRMQPKTVQTAEPDSISGEQTPEQIAEEVDQWLRAIYRGEVSE